ncbi:putative phospholipase A2 1 isoform X1 [Carex littledalei]|uniref:phospholipase A2 n=1 Tax=Carex littledalei TaxID=544730 RepID=A0A833VHY9_9POAL|nr:putative phospholipase A2 1 isoform X1 [Carex littledalei]
MRRTKPSRLLPSLPLLLLLLLPLASRCEPIPDHQPQVQCSRSCVAEDCNSMGIKYGKYCGVGWSGCPGEKPCDDLDACCKIHDECVEKKGMMSVWCHEKFKRCIKKVKKSGKLGFSKECPYEVAMPTMIQGMDMAILFSQIGSNQAEL